MYYFAICQDPKLFILIMAQINLHPWSIQLKIIQLLIVSAKNIQCGNNNIFSMSHVPCPKMHFSAASKKAFSLLETQGATDD